MNLWELLALIWLGIVPVLILAAILVNLVANNVSKTREAARAHWNGGASR